MATTAGRSTSSQRMKPLTERETWKALSSLGALTPDEALRRAYSARADHQMLQTEVRALGLRRQAASAERLPALSLSLDYGAVGVTPASVTGTVGGFAALTIPLFQGGRVRGEVAQADAALAQRRAQLENLRGQIEQDVRSALLDLDSAAEQVDVARSMVVWRFSSCPSLWSPTSACRLKRTTRWRAS
jgi:outer membrane protein TolC